MELCAGDTSISRFVKWQQSFSYACVFICVPLEPLGFCFAFSLLSMAGKSAKAKAKGSAKAKKVAKEVAALPAAAKSGRSNSTITADKGEAKKTRKLNTVVKMLIDKWFPGATEQQQHSHIIDSKSLWQYISDRKVQNATRGEYFEDEFWAKTAEKYSIDLNVKPAKVIDDKEKVDLSLVSALTSTATRNMKCRSKSALIAIFKQGKDINQRSLCGIVCQLAQMSPSANADTANIFTEFMKCCLEQELHTKFQQELLLSKCV